MPPPIAKWFDVRPGERRLVVAAAAALFTTIAGHTLLETARDALFLRELEPSSLTLVYGALAFLAVLAARGSTALCRVKGERWTLGFSLVAGIVGALGFYLAPKTQATVFSLYLWTGVMTSVAVAQFWVLAARVFTIAQAKRLLGPIASAGILGGVVGGGVGIVLLRVLETGDLLSVAAACFALALLPLRWITGDAAAVEHSVPRTPVAPPVADESEELPANRRYLRLVTLLIAVATMTLLCIDYMFKATAARELDSGELGGFFARYYTVLNLVAFTFQLVLATQLLRRLGVLASVAVLPLLLVFGSLMTFIVGPILAVVLLVKGADGSLRHSLHRTATELLWMPLSAGVRGDAKPLVDTFVVRVAQALAAGAIFALAWWQLDTPRVLAAVVLALAFTWLVLTLFLRRPYLQLFRLALQRDREVDAPVRFSMGSLEVLVEALSSMNPSRAIAAMHLLAAHDRSRLIPALTLFHPEPEVLLEALRTVPAADRSDWVLPTERLLDHASEEVRIAAMGALIEHGISAPLERRLTGDNPGLRAHAVVLLAERSGNAPEQHARVRALLDASGPDADRDKIAVLRAVRGRAAWSELTRRLLGDEAAEVSRAAVEAAMTMQARSLIAPLLLRLARHDERDLVRDALVMQGTQALETAAAWLRAADTPPRVRRHLPRTIARFPCQRAADVLTALLDSEPEGVIRYRALRGLGRLAREAPVKIDRHLLERHIGDELRECLRMRVAHFVVQADFVDGPSGPSPRTVASRLAAEPSARLLLELLLDKAAQATERVFRMLQLLHPTEDVRNIAKALLSRDKAAHGPALEYLSTLALDLQSKTRELLRLVVDDLEPAAFVEQVRAELNATPETVDAALAGLRRDDDEVLASVAEYYARRCQALSARAGLPADSAVRTDSKRGPAPTLLERDHVERSG